MTLRGWAEWIEAWPSSQAISESPWMFPAVEVVHVMVIAVVFGSILMVDLRLLGLVRRTEGARDLAEEMLPWTWTAFAVAVCTGLLMFTSAATKYFDNVPFRFKMLLLAVAGVNMAVFHLTAYRSVSTWNLRCPPPLAARLAGGVSILLWIGIVFLGRWVGFIDM
jgi:hypothetical protein